MAFYRINHEQRLYVEEYEHGFSCLGFAYAERQLAAVREWLGLEPERETLGTLAHYHAYQLAMELGAQHNASTGARCPANLHPELRGREGCRVEVTTPDGQRSRFIVGRSSGWMPCHIEIARHGSSGGPEVYIPEGSKVRVLEVCKVDSYARV